MDRSQSAREAWKRRRAGILPSIDDFMAKVEKHSATGCWMWKGSFFSRGYGSFNIIEDGRYKAIKANRQSWIYFRGPIPDGLFVLHKCDNKACVNPDHLYVGTHRQNMDDAIERKQMVSGTRHAHFVRIEGAVDRVRDLFAQG